MSSPRRVVPSREARALERVLGGAIPDEEPLRRLRLARSGSRPVLSGTLRAMGPRPSAGVVALCALSMLACGTPRPSRRVPAAAPVAERVSVLYPRGGCQTGWLEVQVYDASAGRWRPHPEHPRVRAGACYREPSQDLLTDLRVRCVDPSGRRAPSAWVTGTDLRGRSGGCNAHTTGPPKSR